jgi:Skp family chaperone for outer membrane proteins
MKKIAALIAVLLLSAPARAIELSLEENRGDRGSVGYVDMQRLFSTSPDAQRAKESFEELVRQAEERVNLRKAELLKLHQELDSNRAERDALSLSMSMTPAVSTAAAVAPPASVAPPAVVAASTSSAVAVSTAVAAPSLVAAPPAPAKPRTFALPGMSTLETAPTAPPAAAVSSAPVAAPAPAPAKTVAAAAPVIPSTAAAAAAAMFPAPPAAPVAAPAPAGPTPVQRLLELDGRIISIQADIARKEAELMREHDDADHGLLDVESRKTDQVLVRLYRAVSEVARREGVSVVVDKTTILYGQPAVDLTDKVLKFLLENQQP